MTKAATTCFTPRIPSASLSTITIHTANRSASLGSRYYGIMHVVAEAGSVRACQLLRREHAANIWPSLYWPWMLGWVETSTNALEASLRGQTRGSVCAGSDLSDRSKYNIYGKARNRIHAINMETEATTEVVSSPLLAISVSWHYFTFYTRRVCVVWWLFLLSIEYWIEQVEVLPCPTRSPCGALESVL